MPNTLANATTLSRVHMTHFKKLITLLVLTLPASLSAYPISWDAQDNTGWDSWISDNETVPWCGQNCVAFTANSDIMWMAQNDVKLGGNQNMGSGDDVLGLFRLPNKNRSLNVNGDNGSDLLYINQNKNAQNLNNFVVNNGLISIQISASNRGSIVVNNIEALCFLDGCFGDASVIPFPILSPVPVPAGVWLFLSGLAGLGTFKARIKKAK